MAIKFNPAYLPKLPNVLEIATFRDEQAVLREVIEWKHPGFRRFWSQNKDGSVVLCLQWDPPVEPPQESDKPKELPPDA
jgi:hypothetical protein